MPRRLAAVLVPAEGEWFVSWLDRAGRDLGVLRVTLATALGVAGPGGTSGQFAVWAGVPMDLSDDHVERVIAATGFDHAAVNAMLLRRYFGTAVAPGPILTRDRRVRGVGVWAHREWLSVKRSAACPICLNVSGGAWQLSWRLPWAMVCTRHRTYLVSRCPRTDCSLPLRYPGGRKLLHPDLWPQWREGWVGRDPAIDPSGNDWCQPVRIHRVSTVKPSCLFPHDRVRPTFVDDVALLDMQRKIDRRADAVGGADREKARSWFQDLRSRVVQAAMWHDEDLLSDADQPVRRRMRSWCRVRDELLARGASASVVMDKAVPAGPGPLLMTAWMRTAMLLSPDLPEADTP